MFTLTIFCPIKALPRERKAYNFPMTIGSAMPCQWAQTSIALCVWRLALMAFSVLLRVLLYGSDRRLEVSDQADY